MFYKKDVLKYFAKFARNYLCQSWQASGFSYKNTSGGCFFSIEIYYLLTHPCSGSWKIVLMKEKAGFNICSCYTIMFTGLFRILLTIYDEAFFAKIVNSFFTIRKKKEIKFFLLLHYVIRLNFLSYLFIYYWIAPWNITKIINRKKKLCHESNTKKSIQNNMLPKSKQSLHRFPNMMANDSAHSSIKSYCVQEKLFKKLQKVSNKDM